MGHLEWSNEIRTVSISGQKLAEVMFSWTKFGGVLKLIKKAETMILYKVWNYSLDGATLLTLYTESDDW